MATLLDRALMPSSGVGLTAGVNYFGDVGQRQSTSLLRPPNNVAPSAQSLPAAETQAVDTGWRVNPPEPGFMDYGSYGGAGEGRAGEGAPASSGPMSANDAATLGLMGTGVSTLGMLSQDPSLGTMGNVMSGAAAASQGQYGPIGSTIGGVFGGPTGAVAGGLAGQAASQGGLTAPGVMGTLGYAAAGLPGFAVGNLGGQALSGNMTPSSVGNTLGIAALSPMLGPLAGPVGAAVGGGLFGMNSSMSPMGVPQKGYAGLFGTDMGYQLGPEAFVNESTPSGIGTSGGIGFGVGSYGDGSVGQSNVGTTMGGAQGVTASPGSGISLGSGSGGLGLSYGGASSSPSFGPSGGLSESFDGSPSAPSANVGAQEGFDGSPGVGSGGGGGGGGGGGCCFIMLEARYGDGTMDNVVRKYRDEMLTEQNRKGYYKLASVLVPLMRASKLFKFAVRVFFADPLVSYGKWYYKENKHGWLFAPVKSVWMKVFDILGEDTVFIREKPANTDKGAR